MYVGVCGPFLGLTAGTHLMTAQFSLRSPQLARGTEQTAQCQSTMVYTRPFSRVAIGKGSGYARLQFSCCHQSKYLPIYPRQTDAHP